MSEERRLILPQKAADLKHFIGHRVSWQRAADATRQTGIIEDVRGKNALISGEWQWFPFMRRVRVQDWKEDR